MNSVDQVNSLPVSQAAKAQLLKAGQTPNPGELYLYQLLEMGLRNSNWSQREKSDLRSLLDNMAQVDPLKALKALVETDSGDEAISAPALAGKTPQDAAQFLATELHSLALAGTQALPL